tara:strand:- start:95 stop:1426 length:1332 start_codon:yes stop_codon:yes gene_type:complete
MLNEYGFELVEANTEERVIAMEQSILNKSNECDEVDLGCQNRESEHYKQLDLYKFVLQVAWENENTKSPDEVNLLRKLRQRLNITESDHRIIESKLGNYPKVSNEIHTRTEINDVRRYLQSQGLLFSMRRDGEGPDIDIIPEELVEVIRKILGLEIRTEAYTKLLEYRPLRRRNHLVEVLTKCGIEFNRNATVEMLVQLVLDYVIPSRAILGTAPRYGLNNDQLGSWCRDLSLPVSGTMDDRLNRILDHFDNLRPRIEQEVDERAEWYEYFSDLARRDHEILRAQHVIDKDLEIESKFEDATKYLFADKLNHQPLHQSGSNHADGLLSLGQNYLMWDNKSKETPVRLREHLRQFNEYMDQSEKPVPIFLVIGPDFTDDSESEAIRYHSQHFDRNIVLITATELKELAEEWTSVSNRKREEPFPLGMLASTGRFSRSRLGKIAE